MKIGGSVSGGTSQSVLFVDSNGKLAQDNDGLGTGFLYNPAGRGLTISNGIVNVGTGYYGANRVAFAGKDAIQLNKVGIFGDNGAPDFDTIPIAVYDYASNNYYFGANITSYSTSNDVYFPITIYGSDPAAASILYANGNTAITSTNFIGIRNRSTASADLTSSITFYGSSNTETNSRRVTSSGAFQQYITGGDNINLTVSGAHNFTNGSNQTESNYLREDYLTRSGTITSLGYTMNNWGHYLLVNPSVNFNNAGKTWTQKNYGVDANVSASGTVTAGTVNRTNYGIRSYVNNIDSGAGTVNSTNYGLYLDTVSGADTNWGIYDAAGANHWLKGNLALAATNFTPTAPLHIQIPTTAIGMTLQATGANEAFDISTGQATNALRIFAGTAYNTTGPAFQFWGDSSSFKGMYFDAGAVSGSNIYFRPGSLSSNVALTVEQGTGNVIVNDSGTSTADFRVETDNIANAIFVDASADFIGFGTNTPAYAVDFVLTQGGTPYYIDAMFRPSGSNQDMSLGLQSTRLSTTQTWFFGSGSGATPQTNNFRIYDLNNFREGLNIIPSSSGPIIVIDSDKTSTADIVLSSVTGTPTQFNAQGQAQDFTVSGDTKANLLGVYGAVDQVGVNATAAEISSGGGSVLTVKSDADGGFTNVLGVLAPSTTAGNRSCFNVGRNNASNNLNSFCFKYVGNGNSTNAFDIFFAFQSSPAARFLANNTGGVGIGTADPSAIWHVQGTTEQLRLAYDGSNYEKTTVSSAGLVTRDAVGSAAAFTFSDPIKDTRIQLRVGSTASSATPTINTDLYDAYKITALATAITSFTTNLSGTPTDFQKLTIRIKDDGNVRAITWGSSFVAMGVALPTTTVAGKILNVGFQWDSTLGKWGCVANVQEA